MPNEKNGAVGTLSVMISQKLINGSKFGKYSLNTSTCQAPFYIIERKLGIKKYLHRAYLLVKNT